MLHGIGTLDLGLWSRLSRAAQPLPPSFDICVATVSPLLITPLPPLLLSGANFKLITAAAAAPHSREGGRTDRPIPR